MSAQDGEPAFPFFDENGIARPGMSLRDYFAAAALTGIKGNPELCRICSNVDGMTQAQAIAHMAYQDADAMLEARKVKT